jgi:predicted AAA+ superfamily ATPase
MERKISTGLERWKNTPHHKPLLLYGARQVGKTYSILEFGKKHYKNLVYINFESNAEAAKIFKRDLDPSRIIRELSVVSGQTILTGDTLLFFDEIQSCPQALTSLKYFCEDTEGYHIIAAGSLLGVALNREHSSFPVGKVEMITLYPLDFEEFLWAMGKRDLSELIRDSYISDTRMTMHDSALDLYRMYLVVGGMPGAILEYKERQDFNLLHSVQKNISDAYIADMAKYAAPAETTRIMAVFRSIPSQLAKSNHKFQYRCIKSGARAHEYESSLNWLRDSGVIIICNRAKEGRLPLSVYKEPSFFKIYMTDTGLLCAHFDIPAQMILQQSSHLDTIKGALSENYVCFALLVNGYSPCYWESSGKAEVDFIIQNKNGDIIPIEVKSSENVRSKSLAQFIDRYHPAYAIRISTKNFGFDNNIKSVPLYAVHCINQ